MGRQLQQWRSKGGETFWLSMLIDTMEQVSRPELRSLPCDRLVRAALYAQLSRPELRSQPCDRLVVAAVYAQLSRPAAPYSHQGSGFGLRH